MTAVSAPAGAGEGGWLYAMQLTLEDATGEVDANLFDVDGEAFFQVRCTFCLRAAQSWRQTPARVTMLGRFSLQMCCAL